MCFATVFLAAWSHLFLPDITQHIATRNIQRLNPAKEKVELRVAERKWLSSLREYRASNGCRLLLPARYAEVLPGICHFQQIIIKFDGL